MKPQAIARILDANLDRAREGLRVIEDWCRFGLEVSDWATECKVMRQMLAEWHLDPLKQARDTPGDLGTEDSYPDKLQRADLNQVLQANCGRVQESLRVIEEYAKLNLESLSLPVDMAVQVKRMRYRMYDLETQLAGSSLKSRLMQAPLYLVSSPIENWLTVVEKALIGGVSLIQYRNKDATDGQMLQDILALKALCDQYGSLMLVNDRVDLALLANADGVHLGQTDIPVARARQLLGPHKIIGQSTTNPDELASALATSADYVGVGPVYATPTKAGKAPAGFSYVRHAQETAQIPWFAIGGIDTTNLAEVVAAGAERVAVVRSLMMAEDPAEVARTMLTQLAQAQN